ncbi:MAG TPA: helix-turn-helix domain-containing protein [Humisphaera sp.]
MSAADKLLERRAEALLLKPESVAARLEIGQRTLWRWVSAGRFPAPDLRMGRKVVRWRAATVAGWVEANANGGAL